jgi:hypothetical protein
MEKNSIDCLWYNLFKSPHVPYKFPRIRKMFWIWCRLGVKSSHFLILQLSINSLLQGLDMDQKNAKSVWSSHTRWIYCKTVLCDFLLETNVWFTLLTSQVLYIFPHDLVIIDSHFPHVKGGRLRHSAESKLLVYKET